MNKKKGAVEQLDYLYKECVKTNQQIYLFIDEYDHFTNKILIQNLPVWKITRARRTEPVICAASSIR